MLDPHVEYRARPHGTYPRSVPRGKESAAIVGALLLGVLLAAPAVGSVTGSAAAADPTPSPSSHSVPPAAPKPTDSGNSPAVPDPHPPRGGVGPHGEAVGGARLQSRGMVVPKGAHRLPTDLTARSWVLSDLDTGTIIAARDPHGRYQPASVQKLLTTITLLPLLPGTKRVIVSRSAAETEGSHAGLVTGGRYTVDQLFAGLLLVSGNDAAEALAEAAGGGTYTVGLMNDKARSLGAYDTLVQTPSGLDGWQQLTSAYDMTLFLRAALAQPRFLRYDRAAKARLPAQRVDGFGPIELYNQNMRFLTTVPGAMAAKTGFTDAAQHTFVGAVERDGHRYGVVLMRAQRYPHDQWVQAAKLVQWGLSLPPATPSVGKLDTPARASASRSSAAAAASRTQVKSEAGSGGTPAVLWLVLAALIGLAAILTVRLLRTR